MSGLLAGHRAVVTGGASGIGRATARAFAAEGAQVAVLDLDTAGAKAVADEIGGVGIGVDVSDADAVEDAIAAATAELGGLSVLFNNAGVGTLSRLHEYAVEEWRRVLGVNLDGAWFVLRSALPRMLDGGDGRVVSTASISGLRPSAGEGPYAASKAAIAALTSVAALEYAPTIRVNAVAPGMIRSTLTEPLLGMGGWDERQRGRIPLARIGTPEDIAGVVTFLCSDLAQFVTGQTITVDGGMTLHGAGIDGVLDYVLDLVAGGTGDGPTT